MAKAIDAPINPMPMKATRSKSTVFGFAALAFGFDTVSFGTGPSSGLVGGGLSPLNGPES